MIRQCCGHAMDLDRAIRKKDTDTLYLPNVYSFSSTYLTMFDVERSDPLDDHITVDVLVSL
jgi:hypothetical protein